MKEYTPLPSEISRFSRGTELLELALDALEGRGGDAGWNCLLGLRKSSTFFLNRWDGKSHANNAESDT
jgi:hypothetical protein